MKLIVAICSKIGSITSSFLKNYPLDKKRFVRRRPLLSLNRANRKMVELHTTLLNMEPEHLPPSF